jgi:hypothetical protein
MVANESPLMWQLTSELRANISSYLLASHTGARRSMALGIHLSNMNANT